MLEMSRKFIALMRSLTVFVLAYFSFEQKGAIGCLAGNFGLRHASLALLVRCRTLLRFLAQESNTTTMKVILLLWLGR